MYASLPLNSLNTFVSAAEHMSFQNAADALHVSASAVSHQVRNLETLLGYQLFDRLDKRVRLTPRGEKLFAELRTPLMQLHEASRRALRGLDDHSLALSVAPAFATGWLLPRLKDFHASHPEINLTVIASTDLADFSTDPFDASIRIGSGQWQNVYSEHLFQMQLVAVCSPGLVRANSGPLATHQLKEYPLIENSAMPGLRNKWIQASTGQPPRLKYHLTVQNLAQIVEAVIQSGDSIGLVDRNFILGDIESGRLAVACEYIHSSDEGYYLSYPEPSIAPPSLHTFKSWLFSQLEKTTN